MRRAPSLFLFAIVLSAGLGFIVQSALRGQGAAVSSTPRAAATEPAQNAAPAAEARSVRGRSAPAASNVPSYGSYSSAGMSRYGGAGDQEAWQAQQEIPKLLAKYGQTTDETERAKIKDGLSKVLAKLFDLQQKEREREIADIEGRVKRLREMLDKRTKARQSIISNRLDQLLREAEGLGWVEPAPGSMPGMPGMGAGGMGGGYGGFGGMGMGASGVMGSSGPARVAPTAPQPTPAAAQPAPGAAPKGSGSKGPGKRSSR